MAQRDYDLAVFIGRFQIFHNGHYAVIKEALKRADHVLVIVGSADEPRSYRNPFETGERYDMIANSFLNDTDRITIDSVVDTIYNDGKWVASIQESVNTINDWLLSYKPVDYGDMKVALIGHEKDHSSFYLKLFPQWDNISVPNVENLSSTELRRTYFSDDHVPDLLFGEGRLLPQSTIKFLTDFKLTNDYANIRDEYEFIKKYKESWANAPYEPTFVTTDACVFQSGHVLLIQRKARPGKGLWALPGGFLETSEKIEDGMIRELREETRIKVPAPVLRGNIKARHVFDDPHRSARGRTITHGFLIDLPPNVNLPTVKGGDDAAIARWWPLGDVTREMMFEDHFDILIHFAAMR